MDCPYCCSPDTFEEDVPDNQFVALGSLIQYYKPIIEYKCSVCHGHFYIEEE